jgi:hypothetical protein
VPCLTYVIRPLAEGLPSRAYRDAIVAGLKHHGLPGDYVASVQRIEVASGNA